MINNPYPETITDEASGIVVTDLRHRIWEEGYKAGKEVGGERRMKNNERAMLTIREVAHRLNIHPNTVRRWSNQGLLQACRISTRGDRRFRREDIYRFLGNEQTMTTDKLGEILKERRKVKGWTLMQLSSESGVSASHIGRTERGKHYPSAHVLTKLAKPLGFAETELLKLAGFQSRDDAGKEARA